ncbi:MAG TPA: hypothetical protein PL129_04875, partial [bacterium]|nr:hypothetical protein [bacterium]
APASVCQAMRPSAVGPESTRSPLTPSSINSTRWADDERSSMFSMPSASATVDEVVTHINGKSKGEEVLKKHDVQEALDSMLRDFNGETTLNNNGDVRYTFPQIEQELKESELLRKNRSVDNDLGAVIVDTQNTQS